MYLCKPLPAGGKEPTYEATRSPFFKSFPGILPISQCKISKLVSGLPRRCRGSEIINTKRQIICYVRT